MQILPDDALVVRGGLNLPEQFETGSGVTIDAIGNLQGVSVNCGPNKTIKELSSGFPHSRLGVTTVGEIRAVGGDVQTDPTPINPYHCLLKGLSVETAHNLFTPTIPNPSRVR